MTSILSKFSKLRLLCLMIWWVYSWRRIITVNKRRMYLWIVHFLSPLHIGSKQENSMPLLQEQVTRSFKKEHEQQTHYAHLIGMHDGIEDPKEQLDINVALTLSARSRMSRLFDYNLCPLRQILCHGQFAKTDLECTLPRLKHCSLLTHCRYFSFPFTIVQRQFKVSELYLLPSLE